MNIAAPFHVNPQYSNSKGKKVKFIKLKAYKGERSLEMFFFFFS